MSHDDNNEHPASVDDVVQSDSVVAESAPLSEVIELSEAPANGRATLRLIQPGWGSSGYYPSEVLMRDGPGVFRAGTQMYLDHPTRQEAIGRPERSVRDLAGRLTCDAFWDGDGLYAEAEIYQHHRDVLASLASAIGVSIRANGTATQGERDGRSGLIIERITDVISVDYVTTPGAGGRVMGLIEANRSTTREEAPMSDPGNVQALTQRLEEAERRIAQQAELIEAYDGTKQELIAALNTERRERQMSEARQFIADRIAEYPFRERTATRLCREVTANVPFSEEGQVDYEALRTRINESAKSAQQELHEANPTGLITGMGGGVPQAETIEAIRQRQVAAFQEMGLSESAARMAAGGSLG